VHAAVLLFHRTPDGADHFDWMIQRAGDGRSPLMTLRVRGRIDLGEVAGFMGEKLADHRADYLWHEGEVSGDRGAVSRVATGQLRIEQETGERIAIRGWLGVACGLFEGRPAGIGGSEWRFWFRPRR